ncbi:MAG: peptidylprolyl isomerase, partial [Elusimicrobia bacterium]|nr:peptidylprolyl isomerase [Elusimicrobiota bacterium]
MSRFLWAALLLLPAACRRSPDASEVVARVGQSVITQSEFREKLAEVTPAYQDYVTTPDGRRQFLDVLIREKLILEAAKRDGVAQSPEFRSQMEQARKDEEAKLAAARDYMLTQLWLKSLRDKGVIAVTDDEVRDYYKKNPVEVRARHILLATPEQAEAVIAKIRGGASFSEMAKKESLDGETAAEGGRMRPALLGETLPELEVLFKMRVGELAGPVRSKFGYHVLLKDGEDRPPLDA